MKNLILFFALVASVVIHFAEAVAQETEPDHSCLDELPGIIAEINSTIPRVSFCDDFAEGVIIAFDNIYSSSDLVHTQGGGPRLLGFRQGGLFRNDSINRMSIILTPRTDELWDLSFRDNKTPDVEKKASGGDTFVVWGREQRKSNGPKIPLPFHDNSMRVFKCLTGVGRGCHTFYNVPVCEGYYFPNGANLSKYNEARPVLVVLTKTPEASEKMLNDYQRINLLVRDAIQKITEISCE